MTGHTETPWVAVPYLSPKGKAFIKTLDGKTITSGPILSDANAAFIVRAVNRDHAFDDLVKALGGNNFGSEFYPDYLQPIGWLETLLKECERPEVFKALAGDDPDATHSMLFICRSIVERGRAALAKAGSGE